MQHRRCGARLTRSHTTIIQITLCLPTDLNSTLTDLNSTLADLNSTQGNRRLSSSQRAPHPTIARTIGLLPQDVSNIFRTCSTNLVSEGLGPDLIPPMPGKGLREGSVYVWTRTCVYVCVYVCVRVYVCVCTCAKLGQCSSSRRREKHHYTGST